MIKVIVDGVEVFVEKGSTVLQACEAVKVEIPRFCYHERLSIAGNCRMCLVEIEKTPKPVASCAMPTMEGMKIYTNTPLVKKAREAVLEFLLINHPLDCPICDQGGECDLQDQAMLFGSDRSRFYESKRSVTDKNCGPLIKTIMTRCIHCTRCVRFASEIAGVEDLGTTGRGNETEIGTYIEKTFESELSGNVIDLCPVGALTSKGYAFQSRPWELRSTNSIDISDSLGSNIKIDSRGTDILRITPRFCEDINEEWISDKTRFSFDGLNNQRIESPYYRKDKSSKFEPITWEEAFSIINNQVNSVDSSQLKGIIGQLIDLETTYLFKEFLNKLGCSNYILQKDNSNLNIDLCSNYGMNTLIKDIEESDCCVLIGMNPRLESSMLNVRLRKRFLEGGFNIGLIGNPQNLTYDYTHLGTSTKTLLDLAEGKHSFCKTLLKSKKPMIIYNPLNLEGSNNNVYIHLINSISKNIPKLSVNEAWSGFNTFTNGANDLNSFELGISNKHKNLNSKIIYLLGADEYTLSNKEKNSFVIYQGHHGSTNAQLADIILPSLAFTEKESSYINIEGKLQETKRVYKPSHLAREDWKILRALSEVIDCMETLNFNSKTEIKRELFNKINLSQNNFSYSDMNLLDNNKFIFDKKSNFKWNNVLLKSSVKDFYNTNIITQFSKLMNLCSKTYNKKNNFNSY